MTAKDKADLIMEAKKTRMWYHMCIVVLIVFIIAGLAVLVAIDNDEVITDIQLSDGSIVHDVKASDLGPGINATAYQAILDDLEHNLTIHIAANATQNVSIWKGDKLVCYVPR